MSQQAPKHRPAVALTVAGSDSGGGAGLQADLKTFAAFGVFGTAAVTAVTAQDTRLVHAVHEVPADVVAAQVRVVLADFEVGAVKTGMLASAGIIAAVAEALAAAPAVPLVVDPVMRSKAGAALLPASAAAALLEHLLPRATLLTPNVPEAAALLGVAPAVAASWSRADRADAARRLCDRGARAVLIKGGHARDAGRSAADVLVDDAGEAWFERPWITTTATHGTGCALSAAVTAGLALGRDLRRAVGDATAWLQAAIVAGIHPGRGLGSPHHLHWFVRRAAEDGEATAGPES